MSQNYNKNFVSVRVAEVAGSLTLGLLSFVLLALLMRETARNRALLEQINRASADR